MATFNKDEVVVRPAMVEDYEAVMAIDTYIYDGMDYLPASYMVMMQDPKIICCLAEVKGKVVSKEKPFPDKNSTTSLANITLLILIMYQHMRGCFCIYATLLFLTCQKSTENNFTLTPMNQKYTFVGQRYWVTP